MGINLQDSKHEAAPEHDLPTWPSTWTTFISLLGKLGKSQKLECRFPVKIQVIWKKKKKNNYFCLVSSGVKNEEDKKTSKKPKLGNSTKFLNSALQQHPGMKSREARFPAIAWGGGGAKTTRAWAGSWDRERASVGKPGKHKETYSLVDW